MENIKMSESNYEMALTRRCSSPHPKLDSHISISAKRSTVSSSCRICLSSILDPASLTCGHRFCEQCLHKYWHAGDRPDFIVCPLCRAWAFNVDFDKKKISSTDFRKTFDGMEDANESDHTEVNNTNYATIICIKIMILMSVLYYLLKYLRVPLTHMFTFLRLKLRLQM